MNVNITILFANLNVWATFYILSECLETVYMPDMVCSLIFICQTILWPVHLEWNKIYFGYSCQWKFDISVFEEKWVWFGERKKSIILSEINRLKRLEFLRQVIDKSDQFYGPTNLRSNLIQMASFLFIGVQNSHPTPKMFLLRDFKIKFIKSCSGVLQFSLNRANHSDWLYFEHADIQETALRICSPWIGLGLGVTTLPSDATIFLTTGIYFCFNVAKIDLLLFPAFLLSLFEIFVPQTVVLTLDSLWAPFGHVSNDCESPE